MEKVETQLTQEVLLEQFDIKFTDKQEITLSYSAEMKSKGISTEMFLNFIGKRYGYLFHGSRNEIPFGEKIISKSGRGTIFASSDSAIAILRAIYLNNAENLGYPMFLDRDNSNLILEIDKPQPDTIGEHGYVYVIPNGEGLEQDQKSNWQYSKKASDNVGISFIKKVEIDAKDFKYPVEIV